MAGAAKCRTRPSRASAPEVDEFDMRAAIESLPLEVGYALGRTLRAHSQLEEAAAELLPEERRLLAKICDWLGDHGPMRPDVD